MKRLICFLLCLMLLPIAFAASTADEAEPVVRVRLSNIIKK